MDATWYMLEDCLPDLGILRSGKVLSLTPQASCRLLAEGVEYSILEDIYGEKELFEKEEDFFREQLAWLRGLDDLIKEEVSICREKGLELFTAHYYRIKFLVDSVILNALVFGSFLEKASPSNVVYIAAEKGPSNKSFYASFEEQGCLVRAVARKACEKVGVPFELRTVRRQHDAGTDVSVGAKERLKHLLKGLRVKSVYDFVRYGKMRRAWGAKRYKDLCMLSLHAGCVPVDSVIRELIGGGGRALIKSGKDVTDVSGIFDRKIADLSSAATCVGAEKVKAECLKASERFFAEGAALGWIKRKCGFDVSDMLAPYFRDLIQNEFFEGLCECGVLEELYKKENVDFVISRTSSEKDCVSSLLAAADDGKRVCFQHFSEALEARGDHLSEVTLFDRYFAMNDEAYEHIKTILTEDYSRLKGVYRAPCQLREVKKRWGKVSREKDLVMYIPAKLFFGFRNYNCYMYPLTWYFELEKALIDLFASRNDLRFIFKYASGQNWSAEAVLPYIKAKGVSNIAVEDRPVSDCLGKAGRVLLDYPSTGLYEAAAAGIPVMSLYYGVMDIKPEAAKLFGRSLQKFDDIEEAVRRADEFLSGDAGSYKIDVPMVDDGAMDVLMDIKANR